MDNLPKFTFRYQFVRKHGKIYDHFFQQKKKDSKSWEKTKHVKIQQVRRRIINNDLP
jgi:hypothetical protein